MSNWLVGVGEVRVTGGICRMSHVVKVGGYS
jgi:hypothetical protein